MKEIIKIIHLNYLNVVLVIGIFQMILLNAVELIRLSSQKLNFFLLMD